jgi:acyl carrier protein
MKVYGLGGYKDIDSFVSGKLSEYNKTEKRFFDLYPFMFSEKDNIFAETNNGFKIMRTTYGQAKERCDLCASNLAPLLKDAKGSKVGLYMSNSEQWIEVFWAILMCGKSPLLLNTMTDTAVISHILEVYGTDAVIVDSKTEADASFDVKTIKAEELFAKSSNPVPGKTAEEWSDSIFLMTSGTSGKIKLCEYNGINFYHQIADSGIVIRECLQVKKHVDGYIKQLAFLPLYHIYGLAAMYMWFGFFSRTFVFLKDYSADTILYTARKHKVTHIFSVPLLWNRIYDSAIKTIRNRGPETYDKFTKALDLVNRKGTESFLSKIIIRKAFAEIRQNIFGDSIVFLISGGSAISPEVLKFFNGIGYHMANGYGATEIGITSFELSMKSSDRVTGSIGKPFASVIYETGEDRVLRVKGPSHASAVFEEGKQVEFGEGGSYNTNDFVREEGGRYFMDGRADDLIICRTGENISPEQIENRLNITGAQDVCLIGPANDRGEVMPVLIVQVPMYSDIESLKNTRASAEEELGKTGIRQQVSGIVLTPDKLMGESEFKKNRKAILEKYCSNTMRKITPDTMEKDAEEFSADLIARVRRVVANSLNISEDGVTANADYFSDLGGSSLDYFSMLSGIRDEFGIDVAKDAAGVTTVSGLCGYLRNRM